MFSFFVAKIKLNKVLKANIKKKNNLLDAIAECEITSIRNDIYNKISILDKQRLELDQQLRAEEKKHIKLTYNQIKYFLNRLRNGDENNMIYRKRLINTLVNKIYLFDNTMNLVLNVQEEPNEVDISIINLDKSSFIGTSGPP